MHHSPAVLEPPKANQGLATNDVSLLVLLPAFPPTLACHLCAPQLPGAFDMDAVSARYPATYQDSMNTVLVQEVIRYNALLGVIASSLASTLKALEGVVLMSPDLEKVANSLYDNKVGTGTHQASKCTNHKLSESL